MCFHFVTKQKQSSGSSTRLVFTYKMSDLEQGIRQMSNDVLTRQQINLYWLAISGHCYLVCYSSAGISSMQRSNCVCTTVNSLIQGGSYNRNAFWKFVSEVKTRDAAYIGGFGIAIWNTRLDIRFFFLQWAIIGGVVVEPYFKGIQPLAASKMNKTSRPFHNNIVLETLDH